MSIKLYDKRYKLTDEDKEEIIRMRLGGNTQLDIANRMGIGQPYVSRLLRAYFDEQDSR